MYFKNNNKSSKCSWFNDGYSFSYYEFSQLQQWLEVGKKLQKIYNLYLELDILLETVDSKHGPILEKKYNKTTGFTSTIAKPIKEFISSEQIKFICRLIEELYMGDLTFISSVDNHIRELRPFKNLMENLAIYRREDNVSRETIEQYFNYITLNSLRRDLIEFWNDVQKLLDDRTNGIIIPEPTFENREFYQYFLQSRDCYVEKNDEIALAIIRKAMEDILTRLWLLHFDNLNDIKLNERPRLDQLPGFLKHKGILNEQELRDAKPFIKYGNAGIHIVGEIYKDKLNENAMRMINNGINFVNDLTKKYIELMRDKNYCNIKFTKIGYTISYGKIEEYISKDF